MESTVRFYCKCGNISDEQSEALYKKYASNRMNNKVTRANGIKMVHVYPDYDCDNCPKKNA